MRAGSSLEIRVELQFEDGRDPFCDNFIHHAIALAGALADQVALVSTSVLRLAALTCSRTSTRRGAAFVGGGSERVIAKVDPAGRPSPLLADMPPSGG